MIELRRPEKVNCLSLRMLDDLLAALDDCRASRIILTAAGGSFCSGLDLKEIAGVAGARMHLERLAGIYRQLVSTGSSTVALVRGFAIGGGAGLLACARTVIASSDLRVIVPAGELAALASVVTPILDLKTGAGRGQAWLGCDLDASGALRAALVDRVLPPDQFDALVQEARRGALPPELVDSPARDTSAVADALRGLDAFLRSTV